ncbi:NAD+ synthase [Bdellovibrionota bacterium FG-1]
MKIAIAQIDPVVGAFEGNVRKIREAYERASSLGARLLLTPELSVCGYPPYDLVDRPEMFSRNEKALQELAVLTLGKTCALAVGHVALNPSERGRAAQNVVTILENGKRVFSQAKTLLPSYDVFDEARYFEPADQIGLWNCDGHKIAIAICEDLWGHDPGFGRQIYGRNPIDPLDRYRELGAELVVSASASPYQWGKRAHREQIHAQAVQTVGAPLIYVNQVGATDEILFDGGSFALDRQGQLTGRLRVFEQAFALIDHDFATGIPCFQASAQGDREDQAPSEIETLTRGLIVGIREYFARTGFRSAVIGLSGGIDSAVVAALGALAIGAKNMLGVAMPSQHSSGHSLEDAQLLAGQLGMAFEVRPIKFLFATSSRELAEGRGQLNPIALENLQARLRGVVLMTLSNHYNALVLTTGNKSELATGYGTLYGDMCGALGPIGDVFKTRVYDLARHLNATRGNSIPERSITKAPSAELKPNQTDQDTLPPYDQLDALLHDYLEKSVSVSELELKYSSGTGWVRDILRRVELNEFKRRQAAPIFKISSKAFGIGRRIPIAKSWDQ